MALTRKRSTPKPTPTPSQRRRHRSARASGRPPLPCHTGVDAATLLGQLVRDRRMGQQSLMRLMMCAGVTPHSLFDAHGRAHRTARPILAHLVASGHAPEFVPQCPREVEAWLKTARVTAAEVRAVCDATGGRGGHRRSSTDDGATVSAEAAVLDTPVAPGTDIRVLLHVAALYMMVRAYRALPAARRAQVPKTALNRRLFGTGVLPDMPTLQASEDYRANRQKTYATTDDCLKGVHDEGLHALFVEHRSLTALRKHLLLRRKPVFFRQRRLLCEHLIRQDGTPRTSIAEIAYAVKHEWDNQSVMDAAVSKFAAMMRRLGQVFA